MFGGSGWGWHIETAVHVVRMVLGGVFDRFPKLQFVVGHLGEALPFMLPRLDPNFRGADQAESSRRRYLRRTCTTPSRGFNFPATFLDLLLEVGVDRIMFSADHPYGSMAAGARLSGANPGLRRRPRAHRPRQCREAVRAVEVLR